MRYTTRAGEDCAPLEQVLNMLMSVVKAIDDQLILNNIYGAPEDVKAFGNVLRHVSVVITFYLRFIYSPEWFIYMVGQFFYC